MRFDTILSIGRPGGDWNFETRPQTELVRRGGDSEPKEVTIQVPILDDHSKIIWNRTAILSLEDCQAIWDKHLEDLADAEIIELRRAAYPSLGDQFDMQLHDQIEGTTTWRDALLAVKDQYPKIER